MPLMDPELDKEVI